MIDRLSAKEIEALLVCPNCCAEVFLTLDSTNQTAKERAAGGAKEGTIVIAEHQTGGRGRLGRTFFSPAESGVYFSLILRPTLSPEDTLLITTAAAVAVCKTVEALSGQQTAIKWVNDVFCGGKKVCGILSEAALDAKSGGVQYVVLGIGINAYPPKDGFPNEIDTIAGAVLERPEAGLRNRLIAGTVNEFFNLYADLKAPTLISEYESRMLLIGQTVTYQKNGVAESGKVLGIDSAFGLRLEQTDGSITSLSAGEVTIGSQNPILRDR